MTFPSPSSPNSAVTDDSSRGDRAATATLAPARAKTVAIPRPIPLVPPVTSTDRADKSNITFLSAGSADSTTKNCLPQPCPVGQVTLRQARGTRTEAITDPDRRIGIGV